MGPLPSPAAGVALLVELFEKILHG